MFSSTPSETFRFLSESSSLKLGPFGTIGVWPKLIAASGLGSVLSLPNPQYSKLDGEPRSWSDMNRLGNADFGVSISLLVPKAPLVTGGAGRANGFGGPVAPALSKALAALGEGGGSTAPVRIGVTALAVAVACGEESAVCFSSSEDSVGI